MKRLMMLAVLAAPLSAGAQAAPGPSHGAAAPAAAPAASGPSHDMMMMKEADKSIPGDSPVFKGVKLQIVSPKEGAVIPGPDMEITFKLTGYKLPGEQPGPHIHVIIDNQPYQPDYDASKPFKVTGLSPGPHTLRAFPSRPWHESIKAPHAFAMAHFFVGKKESGKNLANWPDAKKPLLTYSRPKGNYAGDDAKNVMIDFYVTNAKLSPKGDKVKLVLDGKEELLTAWKPVWKAGLADGTHSISLDLVDAKGNAIPGPFNHTERTFTLNAPASASAPAPAPAQPAATQPAPAPAGPAHH